MTRFSVTFIACLQLVVPAAFAAGDSGAALYTRHCAHCHEAGQGRAPSSAALRDMGPAAVLQALESGSMRILGNMLLQPSERVTIAEYLTGQALPPAAGAADMPRCDTSLPRLAGDDAWLDGGWNGWGNGPHNQRFQSRDAGLAAADIPRLELQWAFAFPGQSLVNAQPTIAGGRLFTGSQNGTVYALDAARGCVLWTWKAQSAVRTAIVIAPVAGRVLAFLGDVKANAYALDADTGALVWEVRVDDHPAARLTGGFQYFEGRLLVPVSSMEEALVADPGYACCTFSGKVVALDAASGGVIWRRTTIDAGLTGASGAAVWSTPVVSARHRLVYVSTGNNYTAPATSTSDAIMALHLDTGAVAWVFQGTAGDAWNTACLSPGSDRCPAQPGGDTDMGAAPMLVPGTTGELVIGAQKTAILHALDAGTGAVVWQRRLGRGGISGGFQWGPASDGSAIYAALSDVTFRPRSSASLDVEPDPGVGGGLFAVDARTGTPRWQAPPVSCAGRSLCSPAQSAAVTVIPGVVFSGALSGVLRAHDTRTGTLLWEYDTAREFPTVNGIAGRGGGLDGPGPVVAGGRLYVTSGYGLFGALPGNVLLAFAPAAVKSRR